MGNCSADDRPLTPNNLASKELEWDWKSLPYTVEETIAYLE